MSNEKLTDCLKNWMIDEHALVYGKKATPKQKKEIAEKANKIIAGGTKNKTLKVLEKQGRPLALVVRLPYTNARVKNQQTLFLSYDKKSHATSKRWIKKELADLAAKSPRNTVIKLNNDEDIHYGKTLMKSGLETRYEVLLGDTKTSLKNLVKFKNPPVNLDHVGLSIQYIASKAKLKEAMKLQKYVSSKFKSHTYFSHTKKQLESDRKEYEELIKKKSVLFIGVYKDKKLQGIMIGGIYGDGVYTKKMGGVSFYLHPSIQGLGVTKTGYLLMLKYFAKNKVSKYYGGTSQPAIKSLGKIMKRELQHVVYCKMK